MPGPCAQENAGDYAPRHNPAVYFTRVAAACTRDDVPIAQLAPDLRSGDLAPYTFVDAQPLLRRARLPGLRRRPVARPLGAEDRRLARLPRGDDRLFITYDEDDHNEATACTPWSSPPRFRPAPSRRRTFTHYSLLRTQEELLGLPLLGQAASAPSMRTAFGLD